MKIAILSDIHGNLPALEAVLAHIDAWHPDHVIVNGDTINRGPQPVETWSRIAERMVDGRGWLHTMGNHEEFTLAWRDPDREMSAADFALFKTSLWTHNLLSAAQLDAIAELPYAVTLPAPDGSELLAMHASRLGTRHGMQPWTTQADIRAKIAPAPAVFITSHTHRFFSRTVDETLIVNSGSVGCPLDGYPLTGYAQVTWQAGQWSAELIRLPYDRAETRRQFRDSGFVAEGGPTAYLLFKEWQDSRGHVPFWGRDFRPKIAEGVMTPWQSVHAYLAALQEN